MNDPVSASEILHGAGIMNPARLVALIHRAIDGLDLDLTGVSVLTEAASGPYVVTPVIAALAGAKRVMALTRASAYADESSVVAQTRALETLCEPRDPIEIHTRRSLSMFAEADIVTNLGFVRPIDASIVEAMKPTAVLPLMCESWEVRPEDVDVLACQAKGIAVLGTNEEYPGLEILSYSGEVCHKLLLDAQLEVRGSKIVVVSGDKFGRVIQRHLTASGACVSVVPTLTARAELRAADALVVADYTREDVIIGPDGEMSAEDLASIAPGITVIVFAGMIDVDAARGCGLAVFPEVRLKPRRMARTLAAVGPRPVIELHAAGLKVGELMWREMQKVHDAARVMASLTVSGSLCQPVESWNTGRSCVRS